MNSIRKMAPNIVGTFVIPYSFDVEIDFVKSVLNTCELGEIINIEKTFHTYTMFFIQMNSWTPKGELFWTKLLENNSKQSRGEDYELVRICYDPRPYYWIIYAI